MKLLAAFWLLTILSNFGNGKTISYTADGTWEKPEKTENSCRHFSCTPSGLTWMQKTNPLQLYSNTSACDALVAKGVKKILFYGDSYLRHIYAAMLITLNGNYESGSMKDPKADTYCRYHNLFNEKRCNYYNLNHYGLVCDGRILLDPLLIGYNDAACKQETGTVALWSFGNHPLGKSRYGVNDPAAYKEFFEKDRICPLMREKVNTYSGAISNQDKCSVWWISTHYRYQQHFPDESPERVKGYNEEMRQYFDSGGCGNVNYIDVFNMTARITVDHRDEADKLTWDKVHWGYEINLMKAQIILNALLSSP